MLRARLTRLHMRMQVLQVVMWPRVQERGVEVVTWEGWLKIDAEERRLGEMQGRPRVKITTVQHMLDIARHASLKALENG
jgi:hypothetical protein